MATKNEKALEQVEEEYKDVPASGKEDNGPTHGSNQPGRNAQTHKSSKASKGGSSAGSSTGGSKGGHSN